MNLYSLYFPSISCTFLMCLFLFLSSMTWHSHTQSFSLLSSDLIISNMHSRYSNTIKYIDEVDMIPLVPFSSGKVYIIAFWRFPIYEAQNTSIEKRPYKMCACRFACVCMFVCTHCMSCSSVCRSQWYLDTLISLMIGYQILLGYYKLMDIRYNRDKETKFVSGRIIAIVMESHMFLYMHTKSEGFF